MNLLNRIARGWSLVVVAGFLTSGVLPAAADRTLRGESQQLQNGMVNGAINPNQAAQIQNQMNLVQQQTQAERAAQGGNLTPMQQATLQNQERTIEGVMQRDSRNNGEGSAGLNNSWNQNNAYQNGYPQNYGNQYVNPYNYQNGYGNGGYGYQQPNVYVNGAPQNYPQNGYPVYQNGNYSQQPGGLSKAGQLLKNLF